MDIVFTTNQKFWSKVFRYLSNDPISHLAFKFVIDNIPLTIDCSTTGGRLMTWAKFIELNEPVYVIKLETDKALELRLFERSLLLVGCQYDMSAYVYGIWRGLLRKILRIPLTSRNVYSHPLKFACTEIFYPITDILTTEYEISFDEIDFAMQTPSNIYARLRGKNNVYTTSKSD